MAEINERRNTWGNSGQFDCGDYCLLFGARYVNVGDYEGSGDGEFRVEDGWSPLEDINTQIIPAANKSVPQERIKKNLPAPIEMHKRRRERLRSPT